MLFLKQVLAFVLIISAALLLLNQLPAAQAFEFEFEFEASAWGRGACIGGIVACLIPYSYVRSRVDKSLGVNDEAKSGFHVAVEEAGSWLCVPAGSTLAWLVLPTAFVVTNGLGGWLLVSLTFGLEKSVQRRIARSHGAKQVDIRTIGSA